MPRTMYGRGAHGGTIQDIQAALNSAGKDTKGVDGWFGANTVAAVSAFQTDQQLSPTGSVDEDTWARLMKTPIPCLFVRCLELTAAFEGHGYSLAVGNFDGAWLTWGIIGFTLKYGNVQSIVLEANQKDPDLLKQAFGDGAQQLLDIMNSVPALQQQWADSVTTNRGQLAEPWRTGFDWLGRFPEVREIQRRIARDRYFAPAHQTAERFRLSTELGIALCFDVHVQNGGVKPDAEALIRQALAQQADAAELQVRQAVAYGVAMTCNPKYRSDVLSRKQTIATGRGAVHGANFVLENWALADVPASQDG